MANRHLGHSKAPEGSTHRVVGVDEGGIRPNIGNIIGIAGGPLYTIYKTITAIKLAGQLAQKYPEMNFVPVFWLADDHDFEEISSINVINGDNKVEKITWPPTVEEEGEKEAGSVGGIRLEQEIEDFMNSLGNALEQQNFHRMLPVILVQFINRGKR